MVMSRKTLGFETVLPMILDSILSATHHIHNNVKDDTLNNLHRQHTLSSKEVKMFKRTKLVRNKK